MTCPELMSGFFVRNKRVIVPRFSVSTQQIYILFEHAGNAYHVCMTCLPRYRDTPGFRIIGEEEFTIISVVNS
jgi:hypothetical protein